MRKAATLLVCVALIASACGEGEEATATTEDDTSTTEETPATTTAVPTCQVGIQEATGYPWITMQRMPSNGGAIPPALDGITYGTDDTHQVPRDLWCQSEVSESEFYGAGRSLCDHPVEYMPNELTVFDPDEEFESQYEGLAPEREANEITEDDRVFDTDEYRLFEIDLDPIDALVLLAEETENGQIAEFPAAPNYIYRSTPRWKGSPADSPTPADPAATVAAPIFEIEGGILVVDDFDSTGTSTSGHGEFIANLLEDLTGQRPSTTHIDLGVPLADIPSESWGVSSAIQSAANDGVSVVNLSFGTYLCRLEGGETAYDDILLRNELSEIAADLGVHFVAAAGNDWHGPEDPLFYPAGYAQGQDPDESWITSVGALGWDGSQWYAADFTNDFVFNVWAPGVAIVSEFGGQAYAWSGTSFAAPHMAACKAAGQC